MEIDERTSSVGPAGKNGTGRVSQVGEPGWNNRPPRGGGGRTASSLASLTRYGASLRRDRDRAIEKLRAVQTERREREEESRRQGARRKKK